MIQSLWGPGLAAHEASEADLERRYDDAAERYCEYTWGATVEWWHGSDWSIEDSERFLMECKALFYDRPPRFVFDKSLAEITDSQTAKACGIDDGTISRLVNDAIEKIVDGDSSGDSERESIVNFMAYEW